MKTRLVLVALMITAGLTLLRAQQPDYASRKAEAEKYYAEGSYAKAHEIYAALDPAKLPAAEARWVQFRTADTLWRSEAATETADSTKYDQAQHALEAMVRDVVREEDKDRVWVEVQESLGDFYWLRRDSRNWSAAAGYYYKALDWWAGSDQLDSARGHYIGIVWRIAKPAGVDPYYYYGYYGNTVSLDVLQNVLKIAKSDNDIAHAHYLIAMTLRSQGGNYDQRKRIPEEFEAALKPGKTTDWYDDALFYYADWLSQSGRVIRTAQGQWKQEPDFVRALELYRRLLAEHVKGETRYYDQAKQRIDDITKPVVGISVPNIFLPDSEVQYSLNWRNTKRVDLALYKVDLTRDVKLGKDTDTGNWLQQISVIGSAKTWFKDTGDKGDYKPGQEWMRLDEKPAPGAYVIEAKSGSLTARDLILVTDTSLVVKTSGKMALFYYCNALNGAPVPGATIAVWEKYSDGSNNFWRQSSLTANQDGLATMELHSKSGNNSEIFAAAIRNDRQAFSTGNSYSYYRNALPWRIYAFTDRPAYRPGEKVQWKFTARQYNGSVYSTPANQTVEYEIQDPRGTKVNEGKTKLNAFGSAWDTLDLTEAMPLGEYRVTFYDEGRNNSIGGATLFRLEEYKLPEFKVTVQTPEENGRKKTFRVGDNVEVHIQADYFFGGAVSNANVEVLVYQNPFNQWWHRPYDYPWFYKDMLGQPRYWYGGGSVVKRETLKTDSEGKAVLTFETPADSGQDFEYRVEARVTDASRREITSSGTVRVTRQSYYVYPEPEHYLYRPQDKVQINIKAIDANSQPVQIEGTVKLTRDVWFEIWLDPNGKEVKGEELKHLRDGMKMFPPAPQEGQQPWRLKFQGYQHDDILTRPVKTDASGEAHFTFTPERDGYYRASWSSEDNGAAPVTAETTVWVATNATTELGYRHGGLEIIVDKDTFRAGQTAPVMLSVPTGDRYVLFTTEAEDLLSYQLVHMTGTVKLIELPIEEKHVPNFFLGGVMVSDRQIFTDSKQVVVPPVKNFLQVDVAADRAQYQPQQEGTLTVTAKDADGKPVVAEVALGLVDESVFYIQQDYAGDPRPFYFGEKRGLAVQTSSTFQVKSYVQLFKDREGYVLDRYSQHAASEEMTVVGETPTVDAKSTSAAAYGGAPMPQALAKAAAPAPPPAAPKPEPISAGKPGGAGPGQEPAVTVRSDFRSTVFWQPDLVTGADGKAVVKVKYPDSLTGWTATARVASANAQFGIGNASTRTRMPLIVRLQAPRFFVSGDSVTLSAVINNNTDAPLTVNATLEADGLAMPKNLQPPVTVPANGEQRVDWNATVLQAGTARIKVTARGGQYADAMEKPYTIYEHGIERFLAKSGKVRSDEVTVKLDIPAQRKKDSTTLTVQVTPSMAVTMLDALPYLIDYPYGCTEQTMSRFLPAVIVSKTLKDLGIAKGSLDERIFGGIEHATADKTHPNGKQDLRKLDDMVKAGLDRLYDFQHSDGGWGWWKEGESDHFMTAYVLWGLTLAHNAGVEYARDDVAVQAADFLSKELVEEEESYDEQAWMLHALAVYRASHRDGAGEFEAKAFDNLWKNRDRLNAYTRALLALAAHSYGYTEKAQTLVRNLENGVKKDTAPDTSLVLRGAQSSSDASVIATAHWGEDGIYWRWSDGGVESTAFALRALLAIDPQNPLIEPVTNWLIKNRRGAQWSNTRDTAITVMTLTEYLRVSGELKSDLDYELSVNGTAIASKRITAQDILAAPSRFDIDRSVIRDGSNEIRIVRKSGNGPIYFAAQAAFFSLEEPIPASGSELFVRRQYYKLVGKPTLLKGYVYERRPLNDNESVRSGERIETVVTIEAKNNYEYLVFEDLKPAGFEAVEIRSGEPLYARQIKSGAVASKMNTPATSVEQVDYTGEQRWVYQELRDRKVALFVDKLPQGVWEIRYDMRAEVPGRFHALPLMGHAMYVPEIRANDSEIRVTVQD